MIWICKYSLFFQLINSFFILCQIANFITQKYNSKQIVENSDIHNNRLMPSVLVSSEGYMQFGLKEVMSQKTWETSFEDLVLVFV